MAANFPSARIVRAIGRLALVMFLSVGAGAARGADAVGQIHLPPGFKAELVYKVPLGTQGSWVCLAVDEKGRLIASDQAGALYRVTPSPLGADAAETKVDTIPMNIGMAQGLLCHAGQLYVVMNGQLGSFSSGLYRLSDSDKDGEYDRFEQLRVFNGLGEHGPHGIVLGPDGKSLYLTAGNFTKLPLFSRSLVPTRWGEDQLLPRIYDPNGHANEIRAPGGWVARMDLDGNNLELVSVGYRNSYDLAFNADGELFAFDSDMEWDIGAPWYRPIRVCHVTSGSDYGWRSGNGPWPEYSPDTLPAVVDAGQGSPTGLTFGTGAKFPAKYQQALFAGDWSNGNIFVVHITPQGASYRGEVERFASAMPLAVTDLVVRPQDGALYFAVGGRQSESALYRIVWNGSDAERAGASPPPAPGATSVPATTTTAPTPAALAAAAAARNLRHSLEEFHGDPSNAALEKIWPQLSNPDRFIRYAARVALEHQPWQQWHNRVGTEPNETARTAALIALSHSAPSRVQGEWADAIGGIRFVGAPAGQQLDLLRAAGLGVIRFDPLSPSRRQRLLDMFDKSYPTGNRLVDRELAHLLVRLGAPNIVERLLVQVEQSATQEEGIDDAISLSAIREGWSTAQRTRLLNWFDAAAKMGGGRSTFGYIAAARDRFIEGFSGADRQTLADRISHPLVPVTAPLDIAPRTFVRDWKLDELVELVEKASGPRNFQAGRRLFSAAACYNCHRIAGEGSSVGPDLTGVGRRFGVRDLLQAIVEPSHEISDQYQQTIYESGGKTYVGRITNVMADSVSVSTDMLDPKKVVELKRSEIDSERVSPVSVMPAGLLNTLSAEEVLDLTAFLRAGGDPQHQFFAEHPTPAAVAPKAGASAPAGAASAAPTAVIPRPVAAPSSTTAQP